MKLLLLVLAVSGAAMGQRGGGQCEDLDAAKSSISDCIAEKADEMAEKMDGKAEKRAERQAEMAKCFTDAGCEDPTPLKKEMKACKKKAIMDGFGTDMISCIEGKGLSVPDVLLDKLFKGGKGGKWGRKGRKGGKKGKKEKKMKKLDALVAKVCTGDSADGAAAKKCAKGLKKARKAERKANRKERRRQRKEERRNGKKGGRGLKACFKAVSKPCRRELIADLCQCADPLKENPGLFADVREDIQQCKADIFGLTPAADDDDDDDMVDAEEAKRRGKKMGKLLKLVCGRKGRKGRGPSN